MYSPSTRYQVPSTGTQRFQLPPSSNTALKAIGFQLFLEPISSWPSTIKYLFLHSAFSMEQIHILVRDIWMDDHPLPGDNDILQTSEGVAGMGLT